MENGKGKRKYKIQIARLFRSLLISNKLCPNPTDAEGHRPSSYRSRLLVAMASEGCDNVEKIKELKSMGI
jgi:hypothetical protein